MKNKIKGELSESGINKIISQLEEYKQDLLRRTRDFCEELATLGIITAETTIGGSGYKPFISLVKEVNPTTYGCNAILIMSDEKELKSEWLGEGNIKKTAYISPTLMMEFGAGFRADASPKHIQATNPKEKVGRGTFPSNETQPFGNENHANQKIWYYMDLDGKWQHSSGVTPKMPMYMAYMEMEKQINRIWRKHFK